MRILADLNALSLQLVENHDVYDCCYVSLARHAEADEHVTTDRDFERLCEDEPFDYVNPVPDEVLAAFHTGSS